MRPDIQRFFPFFVLLAISGIAWLAPVSEAQAQSKYTQPRAVKESSTPPPQGGLGKFFNHLFKKPETAPAAPPAPAEPSKPARKPSKPVASAMKDLPRAPRASGRGKRVFILGDSQSHTAFGDEFQKQISLAGYEVLFHAVKNGSPYYWNGLWKSPVLTRIYEPAPEPESTGRWREASMEPRPMSDYVDLYDPDIFIIQAGTNFEEDLVGGSTSQITQLTRKSVDVAASRGAKVLWIGPPDARDDVKDSAYQDKSVAALREILAPLSARQGMASFFDSRPASPMPNDATGDGEHPGPTRAREWARQAAAWSLDAMRGFESDKAFASRKPASPGESKPSALVSARFDPGDLSYYSMRLRLVAKSKTADPRTMDYTDSFSVFKYEVLNPKEVRRKLKDLELDASAQGGKTYVYVMHWTFHNSGKRSALTPMATKKEGSTVNLRLTPLERHPLVKMLETMNQINDFDDFGAPIFVSSRLLEEKNI